MFLYAIHGQASPYNSFFRLMLLSADGIARVGDHVYVVATLKTEAMRQVYVANNVVFTITGGPQAVAVLAAGAAAV